MTLSLNLTGLPSSHPVPGTYIEVAFAAGVSGGDLSPKKVLLLAPSTAAGTIVQDTEIVGPISSAAEAEIKGGPGSPLHRMAKAFLSVCKTAQVYLVAPTRSAGVAATFAITITNNATGAGTARIEFCEEVVEVAFITGDTPTIIATALVAAFNARTWLPATASNVAGAITLTAKLPGPEGNALRAKCGITTGVACTITQTTEAAFAAGATAATLTAALATIAAQKFNLIIPYTHTGTSTDAQLAALLAQVGTQALPITGIRQKVVVGTDLPPSTSVSLSQSFNEPRLDIINFRGGALEPWVLAAIEGAVQANTYFVNPSTNLDGYGPGANDIFPVPTLRTPANAFTPTEQALMIGGGVTPIALSPTGAPYIVRQVTSYSLNGAVTDFRVRDAHRVMVADWFADTLQASFAASPWRKLSEDPPNDVQPPAEFATPRRVKALVEQRISDGVEAGHLDPGKKATMLAELVVGIDPLNPTRINVKCPVYAVNLLHQAGVLVAESSAAA